MCFYGIILPVGSKYMRFYIFYTQKLESEVNKFTYVSVRQAICVVFPKQLHRAHEF